MTDINKVNLNKRFLESPPQAQPSKRNVGQSVLNVSNMPGESSLTIASLREVLKEELNAALDTKLIDLATKDDVDKVTEKVNQLSVGLGDHEKRLEASNGNSAPTT